jgi:hypothetical protein
MPGHIKKSEGPDPDPAHWLYVSYELKEKNKVQITYTSSCIHKKRGRCTKKETKISSAAKRENQMIIVRNTELFIYIQYM